MSATAVLIQIKVHVELLAEEMQEGGAIRDELDNLYFIHDGLLHNRLSRREATQRLGEALNRLEYAINRRIEIMQGTRDEAVKELNREQKEIELALRMIRGREESPK